MMLLFLTVYNNRNKEGMLYFPDDAFLPFIKEVDTLVKENSTELALKRYGSDMIKVTTLQLQSILILKNNFMKFYNQK